MILKMMDHGDGGSGPVGTEVVDQSDDEPGD